MSLVLVAFLVLISCFNSASAQEFYKGKTIKIVGGFSAGGGFDTYARVLARHMGKHIPGDAVVVLQANRKPHADLPKIPQAINFAKSEEEQKLIEIGIHGDSDIVRTYTLPTGTPKDRVQLLRSAFEATLKDPEFLADAKQSKLNVSPVPVEEIEKDIAGLFKIEPALLSKLKEILYN